MPCRGPDDEPCENLRPTVDRLTRLLCEACQVIDRNVKNYFDSYETELASWWAGHQELDKQRIANEQNRLKKLTASAMAKLTKEEKEVLGLTI